MTVIDAGIATEDNLLQLKENCVELRQCSEPSKQAREIYRKLGYKEALFRKMKICRSQRPPD